MPVKMMAALAKVLGIRPQMFASMMQSMLEYESGCTMYNNHPDTTGLEMIFYESYRVANRVGHALTYNTYLQTLVLKITPELRRSTHRLSSFCCLPVCQQSVH